MIITNLSISYFENIILENITFSFKNHLCILGPNGGGKSTLAKALCGLVSYEGSISINSTELSSMKTLDRAKLISYIPAKMESFEMFTTVKDFVLLGRYPYKPSYKNYSQNDKDIVKEVLEELSITSLRTSNLHELSSGQQQLTLIAQALAQKSKILIFDEPTANLDPKNTALFVQELKKLRFNYKTILITHDIQLASYFDDSVLFIKNKKADFFETDFFEHSSLTKAYEVNFTNENGLLGVSYE